MVKKEGMMVGSRWCVYKAGTETTRRKRRTPRSGVEGRNRSLLYAGARLGDVGAGPSGWLIRCRAGNMVIVSIGWGEMRW